MQCSTCTCMAVVFARLRCGRAADERDELAPSHVLALDEAHNLALHRTTWAPVHCGEILLLMPVRPDELSPNLGDGRGQAAAT